MRVRFQIQGTSGLPGLHTTYWNGASSSPVGADALDVVARVRAFWNAAITLLPTGVVVSCNVPVDVLDETTGLLVGQLAAGAPASVTGTGGAQLPRATMMLLRYDTGVVVNGRRLQGRNFIGPLANTANSGGVAAAAAITTLITAANSFNSGATSSAHVVWHRPSQAFPSGGTKAVVISHATNTEFSVLRSRRD